MNQTELLNLLNNASRDKLTAIPGIGPALAGRLTAARPFDTLEAVQTVKGIGVKLLEKLMDSPASQPNIEPAPAEPPPTDIQSSIEEKSLEVKESLSEFGENISERSQVARETIEESLSELGENLRGGIAGLGETVSKRGQAARQAIEALPAKFEQASKSQGTLWTILVSSAITTLVAILLTLAVLGGINGSLKFATGSQYRTMQREAAQLATLVGTLQQDLDGLRGRVDTLEGLGERTVALEKAQQQLDTDLEAASQQVTDMQAKVTALGKKVTQQEERTQRFETFLKELQALLGNLFAPQGETE